MKSVVPISVLAIIAITYATVGFGWVLSTTNYPPRWQCGDWTTWIGWLHILSDVAIWAAYIAIPAMLIFFARNGENIPFRELFALFSAFIVFCGSTHLMEAIIFWWPAYGLAGVLKSGTAIVSVATAAALFSVIPQAMRFRSPEQLEIEIQRRTQELEVARKQATAIMEASPIGQLVVNQQGVILVANPAVENIFGFSKEELVGQPISMLIPERYRTGHATHRSGFFETPNARRMGEGRDLFGTHKSGRETPIEIGLTPIEMSNANAVLCSVVDLTERKKSEESKRKQNEAIRESEAKLRGVIDASRNFIGVLSLDGTLLEANQTILDATGILAEDVLGKPIWETPWWAHSQELQGRLQSAISTASLGNQDAFEATHLAADGSEISIDFVLKPATNNNGEVAFLIPEGRDITEHKLRTAELERLNTELLHSNRELEEFAYVASHDLQEPLRKITSYAQIVIEDNNDKLGEESKKDLNIVIDGAERLKVLISDLLTFSRVKTHGKPLSVIDANECLKIAIEQLELSIHESQTTITFDELPRVVADVSQLTQLFQNLLSNAIKYRRDVPPVIHVGCDVVDSVAEISIRDNGIGIEAQYFERVFEIFRRLHGRGQYSGTGIGLAICKRMVERFGGRIWVDSPGQNGSTFYFTLNTEESL